MNKINDKFRDFTLGVNKPAVGDKKAVTFGKKITVQHASKAVGGNTVQNFFARLKLFIQKGWIKDKKIQARLETHDFATLLKLDKLFNRAYPTNDSIKDKKVLKFMNEFIRPAIANEARTTFAKDLPDDLQKYLKNLQPQEKITKNILKLVELGINSEDLFAIYAGLTKTEVLDKFK